MSNPCLWTARVWLEFHADNLTRAYRDVLLTLRTYRGHGGLIVPSHATLADRAGCSPRTVQRALQQAQRLGLVSWIERRVRAAWRWLRSSNSYRLAVPDGPVQPGLRSAWPCRRTNGQNGGGGESTDSERCQQGRIKALAEFMQEAAGVPDLLAARRQANEERWRSGLNKKAVALVNFGRGNASLFV